MKAGQALWATPIVVGVAVAVPARATDLPGRARPRGALGFTRRSLADRNDRIRAERASFLSGTLLDEAARDPHGGAPTPGRGGLARRLLLRHDGEPGTWRRELTA